MIDILVIMERRYNSKLIIDDLRNKMVFIGGPRQVGKTTLAQTIAAGYPNNVYLNWDNPKHKLRITGQEWSPQTDCLIFDEIQKYTHWKNLVKGIWDTRLNEEKIIVTGSSRLNVYRRSGDSMLGRYHYHTLHPFSLSEYNQTATPTTMPKPCHTLDFSKQGTGLAELFKFGGFPEPLLESRERTLLRWQNERFERTFREDIRDNEQLRDISRLELLGALLPRRVASPLSLSSLSEDVGASPKTIIKWMEILERNYYCFRVMPYHRRIERALKKESKYYLWDWSEIEDKGARFENMIGSHLLKFCDFYKDCFGIRTRLWYIRDREKREVDFLVTWNDIPWFLAECKLKNRKASALEYYGKRLNVQQRFLVTMDERDHFLDRKNGTYIIPASRFLMALV